MAYSQKYALVQFLEPTKVGDEFDMSKWPLHTTLADVFSVELTEELKSDLQRFVDVHAREHMTTRAIRGRVLGTTPVVLLEITPELQAWHDGLVNVLAKHGAVFNNPEFTKTGYLPHVTSRDSNRIKLGDEVAIGAISLVDLFSGGDWQKRRVIAEFKLR